MGHGLVKPLLFFASGEILHAHHTTTIVEVRGLMTRTPRTALFFFVGLLALLAMPPSVLFLSELLLLAQGVHYALGATIVIGIGVAIASFGLLHSFFEMARPDTREDSTDVTEENLSASHVVMAAQLLLLVLLSLFALSSGGQHALVTIVHNIIL
jgi:formate hydrogenlyase subunit 3/multisubunit Na+/H+ antiporter MnhD subunit